MIDKKTIGKRLRALRQEQDISAKDFAQKMYYSYDTMIAWENGKHKPSIDALSELADYYDVSLDYLVGRSEKRR